MIETSIDCPPEPALDDATAAEQFSAAARALPEYPGGFSGRGVVMPGGGTKYFSCAWVCINMLRHVGCRLPIELWHLGAAEMTAQMRRLVEPLRVRVVDGLEVRKQHPARILRGWELKPFAMMHSRFEEILFFDSDNMPVRDPTNLFDEEQYRALGAIFWPDFGRLAPTRKIWGLTGVAYQDEREFESGQIVLNKCRCWAPLALTMWMNEHSDFWYRSIHGDKETFHLAWRKLDIPYAMPAREIEPLDGVMCQHDFAGRRLFQHRNLAKWKLTGNRRIDGFLFEDQCLKFLDQLRGQWDPTTCAAPVEA